MPDGNSLPRIEVILATAEQEPILDNLLQLYAHDFSEFHTVELDPEGRFHYKDLPRYWSDSNRHPLLVFVGSTLAGFALIQKISAPSNSSSVWDMTDFFILRAHRRRGVGTAVAHEVWKRFLGLWQVRVMQKNDSARLFWERAIRSFTARDIFPARIEKNGECWHVFSFDSADNNSASV